MAYTDRQMKDATQIAYMECFPEAEKRLIESGKEKPFTVRELIEASVDMKDVKLKAIEFGQVPVAMSFQELMKYSNLLEKDIERISLLQKESLDWKVVDIHDKNDVNGFYACTLETSDSDAIVAFRGSESYGNNVIDDWLLADFGLLNSTKTNQQAETERYADELIKKGIIDKYDFLAATGHSLGGNLATHLNVISDEEGREALRGKLQQVVNMDGPGMSHDYLEKYANQIARTSTKVTHYKWSAVGNLLFDIPGENIEFLESDESVHGDKNELQRAFWRHDTKTMCFDEDGKAERGKQDALSKVLGPVSRVIDKRAREALFTALSGKVFSQIVSIAGVKDLISTIGIGKVAEATADKKSACLDVLGATFNDNEINRSSVNVVTNFFNGIKDKLFNFKDEKNSTEMARV